MKKRPKGSAEKEEAREEESCTNRCHEMNGNFRHIGILYRTKETNFC